MRYIEINTEKRFQGKAWVNRFMHLLEIVAPNKYEINSIGLCCYVDNKETGLSEAMFSDNPYRF